MVEIVLDCAIMVEKRISREPKSHKTAQTKYLSANIGICNCKCNNNICMIGPEKHEMLGRLPWSVEQLIATAGKIIASDTSLFANPESESNKELNVRLIRDYVVREFIPRPERIGRESRFGLDHLGQLLAVRLLLRGQKWSLAAIKASKTSTEDLLNGMLAPVRPLIEAEWQKATGMGQSGTQSFVASQSSQTPRLNPAQLLIEHFKAAEQPQAKSSGMPLFSKSVRASPSAASLATQQAGRISSKLHVQLEPWCELVMDAQRLKSLTPEEVERLGEALKSRLRDEAAR